MPRKNKITILTIISAILITLNIGSAVFAEEPKGNIVEERYSTILSKWMQGGIKDTEGISIETDAAKFNMQAGSSLIEKDNLRGYDNSAARLQRGQAVELNIDVTKEGLYNISLDYFILSNGLMSNEAGLQVNGEYQYYEARRLIFEPLWENETNEFARDRYNNEVMPSQKRVESWQTASMVDASHIQPGLLKIYLKQGINNLKLILNSGEVLIGNIRVFSPEGNTAYEQYKQTHSDKISPKGILIAQEAERVASKNDTSINAVVRRDLEVVPYETNALLLNTLGGKTWQKSGQKINYTINAPEDGLYKIAFKYLQDVKANAVSYRAITIDNKIPFKELEHYGFNYTNKWKTAVLGNGKEDYLFYLTKGQHNLGLEADSTPFNEIINVITDSLKQINDISLQIKKLTGNTNDQYRDWEIVEYMPTIEKDLNSIADSLKVQYENTVKLNNNNANSQGLISMNTAIRLLGDLAKEPNKIPSKLNQLSEGTGSAAQSLSKAMEELEKQPLNIDQFYIYSSDKQPPKYKVSIFKKMIEGIKRFINSFIPQKTKAAKETVTLNVWVNRARNYVDLMQKMSDEQFTSKTNIKVNFSLMPNEQKLILANASGTSPDVALGISNWLPYELGVRGAALDLRQFNDFNSYIGKFSPGALIPMIVDDKVYGMPETQDFYVLFYRKDILNSLGIPVPNTWDEVKNILPELQRYGMNFYTNLSGSAGLKPFMVTSPFIYQSGGDMYTKDGMATALDKEQSLNGIKLMTDLFTIYGLPQQAPNFYEHFRSGTLPIGIGTFGTYVQLMNAAPELKGSWAIAPAPGIKNSSGEVIRWQPGSAQSSMVFADTKQKEEAWEFLKWWMDTNTQSEFANQLQTLYGGEYLWNTANLQAFSQLPWAQEDKNVVLEQWKWLMEVPKIPGGYMTERELSNIWSQVVFNSKNPRAAVDEAVIVVNKEIRRKMEEFGYIQNGKVVRPYVVPTIEQVEGWVNEANGKK